jgi:hypothetical protein
MEIREDEKEGRKKEKKEEWWREGGRGKDKYLMWIIR